MDLLRYGIYPLTAFALAVPPPSKTEPQTPELNRYTIANSTEEKIGGMMMCGNMNLPFSEASLTS